MKRWIVCSFLLFAINCSSLSVKEKIIDLPKNSDEQVMSISYDNTFSTAELNFNQDDEQQTITIKNKDKTWKLTYRDFKIFAIGYKNWRVVENEKPEISKITKSGKWVNFTFNYYKNVKSKDGTNVKVSILSGVLSINKKIIRTADEENTKKNMKWWITGLAGYSTVATIILFAIIL